MADTRSPLSTFEGQRAQIRAVTLSHGVIRPNLVDAVDFMPALTVTRVPEFDNETDALIFETFDGVNGRMSYTQSNQGLLEALIMDRDPTVERILVDPARMKQFQLFANLKGQDGNIKGSYLIHTCKIVGNPFTSTVKEGAKASVEFEAINAYQLRGLGLLYTRATKAEAPETMPTSPVLGTTSTGGTLVPDTYYIRITAVTASGETAGSNEAAVEVPAGTNTNIISVTLPVVAGDVTGHNVYVSNRSNDEKFVAVDVTTSYDILALPSPTSAKVPNIDSTGAPQMSGDKDISSGAITLDKAAYKFPNTGLDYMLIMKNGSVVASPNKVASEDNFWFNAAGTTFNLRTPAADAEWWDIFTAYTL